MAGRANAPPIFLYILCTTMTINTTDSHLVQYPFANLADKFRKTDAKQIPSNQTIQSFEELQAIENAELDTIEHPEDFSLE